MERGKGFVGRRLLGADRLKILARTYYDFEEERRRQGCGDPVYVHDEEHGLVRFPDGRFAFSRKHADWALLRKRSGSRGESSRGYRLRIPHPAITAAPRSNTAPKAR